MKLIFVVHNLFYFFIPHKSFYLPCVCMYVCTYMCVCACVRARGEMYLFLFTTTSCIKLKGKERIFLSILLSCGYILFFVCLHLLELSRFGQNVKFVIHIQYSS
jgi:hypothetical protein